MAFMVLGFHLGSAENFGLKAITSFNNKTVVIALLAVLNGIATGYV